MSPTAPRRSLMLLLLALAVGPLVGVSGGCVHKKVRPSVETLRSSAETFHRMLRWGEIRAAAQFVAPTRRTEYLRKVIDAKDEQTLKVNEYELEDAQMAGDHAVVVSSISWYRLPSVTNTTEAMVVQWVHRDSVWFIESIEGGPIPLPPKEPAP